MKHRKPAQGGEPSKPPKDPEFLKDRLSPAEIEAAKAGEPSQETIATLDRAKGEALRKVGWAETERERASTDTEWEFFDARRASATAAAAGFPLWEHMQRANAIVNAKAGGKTSIREGTRKPRGAIGKLIPFANGIAEDLIKRGQRSRAEFTRQLRLALDQQYRMALRGERPTYPFKNQDGSPRVCSRYMLRDYLKKYLPPGINLP